MKVEIRNSPSFSVARCTLAPGEKMKAESGAMMATSLGVDVEAQMQGGLMKGLKRSVLGGESLFISTFTAPNEGGWVDCAANLPGDAEVLEVNEAINITKGNWLCSSDGIDLDTKWGGFKNIGGGEGGFLVRATGTGNVVASCYGALETVVLGADEKIVIDSGHVVAFDPEVDFITRKVTKGMIASAKSGEFFVMEFSGPGRVITQSRNPNGLIGWLTTELPFNRS